MGLNKNVTEVKNVPQKASHDSLDHLVSVEKYGVEGAFVRFLSMENVEEPKDLTAANISDYRDDLIRVGTTFVATGDFVVMKKIKNGAQEVALEYSDHLRDVVRRYIRKRLNDLNDRLLAKRIVEKGKGGVMGMELEAVVERDNEEDLSHAEGYFRFQAGILDAGSRRRIVLDFAKKSYLVPILMRNVNKLKKENFADKIFLLAAENNAGVVIDGLHDLLNERYALSLVSILGRKNPNLLLDRVEALDTIPEKVANYLTTLEKKMKKSGKRKRGFWVGGVNDFKVENVK